MTTSLRWLLLATTVTLSLGSRVEAQVQVASPPRGLRVEWTADRPRGSWQPVCGYIYNDTPDAPREVQLLVEGRDSSERIVESRIVPVVGYIAPWGRTYFCSNAAAGAARYSVTIVGTRVGGDR
jgi:hypothetical protein